MSAAPLALPPRLAIAFSGGCDSVFLAYQAKNLLRRDAVLLLMAVSPFLASGEAERATRYAAELDLPLKTVPFDPLVRPEIAANGAHRCYFCKRVLYSALLDAAKQNGFTCLADGVNADDLREELPGLRAAAELGVIHPLAALPKSTIRELAKAAGLSVWNLPAAACLASRIPAGTALNDGILRQIDRAETLLAQLGCRGARARFRRDHAFAVELREAEWEKRETLLPQITTRFAEAGFQLTELRRYRRGGQ